MSDWSWVNQQNLRPNNSRSLYLHSNTSPQFSASVSTFTSTTTSHNRPNFRNNSSGPFSSFPSSSDDIDEVDECCSYIGKLLIKETPPHSQSRSVTHVPFATAKYPTSKATSSTMTIGHHHHYNNRHHYPYHDHYHDDSPLLPRIEFPSGQFDRLLRGSPSLDRSSDSSNRFTSSTRDSSSSSLSSSSPSPFSSGRLSSWKSGPFDSRKK